LTPKNRLAGSSIDTEEPLSGWVPHIRLKGKKRLRIEGWYPAGVAE
jgi:hypothetical protein